jgi:hypothetical protein
VLAKVEGHTCCATRPHNNKRVEIRHVVEDANDLFYVVYVWGGGEEAAWRGEWTV